MQVHLAAQLRPHVVVFVIGRRFEGAVGEDEMAFLPERYEPRDQFRIVQLVERGIDLAAVGFDVIEELQQLRAKQTAERIAQGVAGLGNQIVQLRILADGCKRA